MTLKSQRRAAEMAVIDAARAMKAGAYWRTEGGVTGTAWTERIARTEGWVTVHIPGGFVFSLLEAIDALDALDLEEPTEGAKPSVLTPETSHDAYQSMRKHLGRDARLVLDAIEWAWYRGSVGLTTEQVCERLSRKHQSMSARVNELRDKGWIVDSGQRRQTVSRRNAIVWTLSSRAREELKR
jgi:hypothetical protein